MKLTKLYILLGVGVALSAITAIPSGAYADCPAGTKMASADTNGAGLPVTQNGTIAPGSTLGGISNDKNGASNKVQSAADDRNGAGLPVTQNGTIAPGSTLGGISNDRSTQAANKSDAACN
jgi:hypothetical protein